MAQINIKIDDQLKDDVTKIFNEMGLDMTTGIKLYLKRVQRDQKIPFELTSHHFDAQKLARQYRAGDQQVVANLNDLFKALGNQDNSTIGIGKAILNHNDSSNGNGIGGSILKNR